MLHSSNVKPMKMEEKLWKERIDVKSKQTKKQEVTQSRVSKININMAHQNKIKAHTSACFKNSIRRKRKGNVLFIFDRSFTVFSSYKYIRFFLKPNKQAWANRYTVLKSEMCSTKLKRGEETPESIEQDAEQGGEIENSYALCVCVCVCKIFSWKNNWKSALRLDIYILLVIQELLICLLINYLNTTWMYSHCSPIWNQLNWRVTNSARLSS